MVVNDAFKCVTDMPKKMGKQKILTLLKVRPCSISEENVATEIICTEMAGANAFEHLELVASEVYLPILSNARNQEGWGEVATREIIDRFHSFLSSTTIMCGQIKGETCLPMPPIEVSSSNTVSYTHLTLPTKA